MQPRPPGEARAVDSSALYCPKCGYDLRARSSPRCPECGLPLDFIDSPRSAIPWVEARGLGAVRGYVATVFDVCFQPSKICREAWRPVDYRAARRFQLVTVGWIVFWAAAYLAVALLTPVEKRTGPILPIQMRPSIEYTSPLHDITRHVGVVGAGLVCAGLLVGLVLAALFATGAPSYLFCPRNLNVEQQNRALALSYYACAPLAFAPLVVGLLCWVLLGDDGPRAPAGLWPLVTGGLILHFLAYLFILWCFSRRLLFSAAAELPVVLLTPLLWLLFGVVVPVGLLAALGVLGMIIRSLF